VAAGKRSVEIEVTGEFLELQASYLDELSFLREMDNVKLYDTLREYSALRSPDQVIADATQYVSRMTSYPPGSDQFNGAVADLVDQNSKRAIKGQNRRSVEQLYSYRESGGDYDRLMVWIGELGGKNCAYCPPLFGEVRTYGEWIESGTMPGSSVCAGGDYCRCHLAAAPV
jgi:hypothetical protein